MNSSLHHPVKAEAKSRGTTDWLTFTDEQGSYVTIFMPLKQAVQIVDAFNRYATAEPPEPDDAMAAHDDQSE